MDTLCSHRNDGDDNWMDSLLGRAKTFIGFSSCPSDDGDEPVKNGSSSIENQQIKLEDSGDNRCAVTYTDLAAAPPPTSWLLTPGALVAIIVATLSISLSSIMWLTSAYDNAILKLVSIRDDIDLVFDIWRMPPTRPTLTVYPFHYKNYDAVIAGTELPEVEEKGPFIFREKSQRVNIVFNNNSTVSFQEMKNITFDAEKTNGSLSQNITTPNVPFIVILKKASTFYYFEQKLSNMMFDSVMVKPFHNVSVNDFLWGYEDEFFKILSQFITSLGEPKPQPFGFLAKRRGLHHDIITEKTGAEDLNTIGTVTRWGGTDQFAAWGNTSCGTLTGSDGTIFPAHSVRRGDNLFITSKEMCRRIPILFKGTVQSRDGFPAQQYNMDENMFNFDSPSDEQKCYKLDESYPPSGSFHSGPCQNGMPIFFSFPHFWNGGEQLRNSIRGLKPNRTKHESYFHIHKELGISLLVRSKVQLNIMLQKSSYIRHSSHLKVDKLILPIAWLDYDSGELPEDFVNVLYHLTFTAKWVEILLRWFLTLCATASVIYLVIGIRKNYKFLV